MDVVKLFGEGPLVFCVVNLEAAVCGDAVRTSGLGWEFGALEAEAEHTIRVGWDLDLYQEFERMGRDWLYGVT